MAGEEERRRQRADRGRRAQDAEAAGAGVQDVAGVDGQERGGAPGPARRQGGGHRSEPGAPGAKTGRRAGAPPSSTANRSRDIVPSRTRRLWMKATPEKSAAIESGSRVRATGAARIAEAEAPASAKRAPAAR